jgi:hypothetical protein
MITGIFFFAYLLGILTIIISASIKYSLFVELIKKEDEENGVSINYGSAGFWIGGTFYLRMPIPIIRTSEYPGTAKIIRQYNNLVKAYWIFVGVFALALFIALLISRIAR